MHQGLILDPFLFIYCLGRPYQANLRAGAAMRVFYTQYRSGLLVVGDK